MNPGERLLQRLDAIAQSVADTGQALALLGFGSAGPERDRLDAYSDLDFFVIARPGQPEAFLSDLDWLARVAPIAYAFQHEPHGYKVLFEDGIFCEWAVFEPAELAALDFPPGGLSSHARVIWRAEGYDDPPAVPHDVRAPRLRTVEWLVGEALTNLYVGLGRYRRGEQLSAARFIQGYAVDRLVELSERVEPAQPAHVDAYTLERRYEQRFPQTAQELPRWMQGYARSVESAREILAFLERYFEVNPAIKARILALCDEAATK